MSFRDKIPFHLLLIGELSEYLISMKDECNVTLECRASKMLPRGRGGLHRAFVKHTSESTPEISEHFPSALVDFSSQYGTLFVFTHGWLGAVISELIPNLETQLYLSFPVFSELAETIDIVLNLFLS